MDSRLRGNDKKTTMKTLSFVIPVYNEEKRLKKTFKALLGGFSFDGPSTSLRIKLEKVIFVDDGSADKTKFKIQNSKFKIEKALKAKVQIISYPVNKGKGYAVKQGMLASNSDYTLIFDADMSISLKEFKKFLPFINKNVDVIVGTRKNGHSTIIKRQPWYREQLGRGFTILSNVILNTWVTDFTCGFKAFSREAKQAICKRATVNRWGYDAELIFLAQKLGFSMQEKSVLWRNDERTKVNLFIALPQTLGELFLIRWNDWLYNMSIIWQPLLSRL